MASQSPLLEQELGQIPVLQSVPVKLARQSHAPIVVQPIAARPHVVAPQIQSPEGLCEEEGAVEFGAAVGTVAEVSNLQSGLR